MSGLNHSDILALTAAFRALVQAREDVAVAEIIAAYTRLYQSLQADLDALLTQVAEIRAAGGTTTIGQAARMERLQGLVESVESEVAVIAGTAEALIANGQRALVGLGTVHAHQLILTGMGTPPGVNLNLNRVPADVVETMVGFLRGDTPLGAALDMLPGMAGEAVRDSLVRGVATGRHPRVVAREFRTALGGSAASAERLARTAQIHAYRTSVQETYRQNPTVVREWEWSAGMDDRTCMSCVSMHGQRFPLEEPLIDHWNGRCVAVPVTVTWQELLGEAGADLPEPPPIETGLSWFNRQPDAVQRRMLGRAKYHAWKAGELDISQLSKVVDDPIWGEGMRVEASLKDILGVERARHWYAQSALIERELVIA